jgi:hypothetical protein
MENISTWEIALIVGVGYLAINALVKMMVDYRDGLTSQLEEQAEEERQRQNEEAAQKRKLERQAELRRKQNEAA